MSIGATEGEAACRPPRSDGTRLAIVEVTRPARRIEADASVVLDECDVVLLDAEILHAAAALDPTTLDAIQLATVLSLSASPDAFVAYDERLLAAARHHGLDVASPGRRPRCEACLAVALEFTRSLERV
jgi:hypothetical protein